MNVREQLRPGLVIPAHPLALTSDRKLDERRQRALSRYYIAAGAGGLAVGVHTTQFAIRDPRYGLLRPVLEIAAEEMATHPVVRIAGVCGATDQALAEVELANNLGYHAALVSLGALPSATCEELIEHCRAVAAVMPVIGFYLQPSVGGRPLSYAFWRRFAEIENVVAIKIAPFNRYQTLDVIRAVADSGRAAEIALYTGNDDTIVFDLLTLCKGGLLGQWAVWTRNAVSLLQRVHEITSRQSPIPADILALAWQITDANAALFDAANNFQGCIAGIHEILRRQGLLAGRWCLDSAEDLSLGQLDEIDRVCRLYPHLQDNDFVREHLDAWLR